MSELTLLVLRLGLLALLWIFVFLVIYSVRSDLFGPRIPRSVRAAAEAQRNSDPAPQTAPAPAPAPTPGSGLPKPEPSAAVSQVVITAGPKAGTTIDLPETGLVIGRSSSAGLQVSDDYTSNRHAKVSKVDGVWALEDLGSTNGTFLSGKRVSTPVPVPPNTTVRIGTTQFELRPQP